MTLFPLAFNDSPALIDGDKDLVYSYKQIKSLSEKFPQGKRSLVFLFAQNTVDCISAYLGAINQGHVVCLLDSNIDPAYKSKLISHYRPQWIIDPNDEIVESPWSTLSLRTTKHDQPELHPELQLLLSTSGTTGSVKLVRLSKKNILENAKSIIEYLGIGPQERAMLALPFTYSFGLSILHTHLLTGASLVLTQESFTQNPFYKILRDQKCTSVSGVPFFYSFLDRMQFDAADYPDLNTMTHAGGRLEGSLVRKFYEMMRKNEGRFFSMYGQTEATARIAYVPPQYLPEKAGAIGIAIPNGKLSIDRVETPYTEGEIVYEGPNVMLGMAENSEDLALGDVCHGKLHTGDIGKFDDDHIYYVTGRIKRMAKIFGNRINLEEIETELTSFGQVAVVSSDDTLILYHEYTSHDANEKIIAMVAQKTHLHPSCFRAVYVPKLPRTERGKIDYRRL